MDRIDEIILERIKRDTVSGEELSEILGISRSAVWKRIRKLEEYGYTIDRNRKGYRLKEGSDLLLPYEVRPYIKTNWLGKNYIFFEEIQSTNSFARENDYPDGTVVVAESQTAGRGRKGRKWISVPHRGIYASIILKRNINPYVLPVFSLLFPLAVRNVLQEVSGLEVKIKWPNDLYVNGKKIAGFLIETDLEGNTVQKIVAGFGININQTEDELSWILDTATSLHIETGNIFDRKSTLGKILVELEKRIDSFSPEDTIREINEGLLWKGEEVYIPDENVHGKLLGVDNYGGVKILMENGVKSFYSGDLSLRKVQKKG
ncbi:biotin--[acetyl-CoA-carboxylase] ligase [Persephonella sp.]